MKTTQRHETWRGQPVDCGDAWVLRKNGRVARCNLVTHPFGWELRLMVPHLLHSQVCGSADEIVSVQQVWSERTG
jgi:hypothetical protein